MPESAKNGSRDAMDILQDIFRKIGSKENSKEVNFFKKIQLFETKR